MTSSMFSRFSWWLELILFIAKLGPLRLLQIFQIFERTLGHQESPSGLGESQATEATANILNFQEDTGPSGKSQWPGRVPGTLRLLPIFQIFKRTLGLWESPGGLGESAPITANISNFQKTLGLRESARGLGVSWATEATANISNFQKDTVPSGKCQWPGSVLGHWGYCQYYKYSKVYWAFGKVPVARECPGP